MPEFDLNNAVPKFKVSTAPTATKQQNTRVLHSEKAQTKEPPISATIPKRFSPPNKERLAYITREVEGQHVSREPQQIGHGNSINIMKLPAHITAKIMTCLEQDELHDLRQCHKDIFFDGGVLFKLKHASEIRVSIL